MDGEKGQAMNVTCYWLEHEGMNGGRRRWKRPTVATWKGQLWKLHGDVRIQNRTKRMVTIFDHTTTPPTLVRSDYSLADLLRLKAELPEAFIDYTGVARRTSDGTALF